MQITLSLPDEVGQALQALPDPEVFVAGLVKAALQHGKPVKKRPLGALKGRLQAHFSDDFKMTDEEFLQS